jgi:hypothetical protein
MARTSRNAEAPSQSFRGPLSGASHSAISARRGPAKPEGTHFGTTQPRGSASAFVDTRFGTPFAGSRFANPFDNRFGLMMSARNGFAGTRFNRFDPNIPHVSNNPFGFNQLGFNRFAFHNFFFNPFFFDCCLFFNRFGFFPFFFPRRNFFFDFALFPSLGFFGSPWSWEPGWTWWGPTSQWGQSSSPPPTWGSNVRNSNPDQYAATSSASAESPAMGRNENKGSPGANPITGNDISAPSVLLYLKDDTMYAASDYWFAGNVLHFIMRDAGESTVVAMDELDLQRTVEENAKRGVPFTLKQNPNDSNTAPNKPE